MGNRSFQEGTVEGNKWWPRRDLGGGWGIGEKPQLKVRAVTGRSRLTGP